MSSVPGPAENAAETARLAEDGESKLQAAGTTEKEEATTEEVCFFTTYFVQPIEWVGKKLCELADLVIAACKWVWNKVIMCGCLDEEGSEEALTPFQEREEQVRNAILWLGDSKEDETTTTREGLTRRKVEKTTKINTLSKGELAPLVAMKDLMTALSPEGWSTAQPPLKEADVQAWLASLRVTTVTTEMNNDVDLMEEEEYIPSNLEMARAAMVRLSEARVGNNFANIVDKVKTYIPADEVDGFETLFMNEERMEYFGSRLPQLRQALGDHALEKKPALEKRKVERQDAVRV